MKQQINLYLSEFRVKKDPLTAVLMAQVLGGVAVLLVLVSVYQVFTRWQLGSELDALRVTLQEETLKTDELDEILARRSQSQELTDQLEAAERRLQSRRQIRDFLGETQLGNVVGFSEYFKDLSRASMEGLSLTEFSFRNGGRSVALTGVVLDSAMVPRYVNNLEAGSSTLRDMHFSPSISRADSGVQFFQFSLSSTNE